MGYPTERSNSFWNYEREQKLRALCAEGKMSASQIQLALGAPTRNTVIGKINRLKLAAFKRAKVQRIQPTQQNPSTIPGPSWTHEQDQTLFRMRREGRRTQEIALAVDKTIPQVNNRIAKFKLPLALNRCMPTFGKYGAAQGGSAPPANIEEYRSAFTGQGISLLEKNNNSCLWPVDYRAADGIPRCCGEIQHTGLPYCIDHVRRAYAAVPSQPKVLE